MLPICQFPLSVVIVDDDRAFLHIYKKNLSDDWRVTTFDDPLKAAAFLNAQFEGLELLADVLDAEGFADHSIRVDIEQLSNLPLDASRFSAFGLVMVDYSMPQASGLEFCQKISTLPLKKIMLTGVGDDRLARDAFNMGLIDRYIEKSDDGPDEYYELFFEAQRAYFEEQTKPIKMSLKGASDEMGLLDSEEFTLWFDNLRKRFHIIEHYVITSYMTILLLDHDANAYYLQIHDDETVSGWVDALQHSDQDCSNVIKGLEKRSKLPLITSTDIQYDSWQANLHDCDELKIDGKQYWYALINADSYTTQNKIVSYNAALVQGKG